MSETHLKQPRFTYSACGPFTKNKEYKNLRKQEIYDIFTEMDQIKLLFGMICPMEYLMIQQEEQLLINRFLRDKGFNIAKNRKYDGHQRGVASMVYKCFDKKPLVEQLNPCQINNLQMNFINQLLKNFEKEEFIRGADRAVNNAINVVNAINKPV